MRPGSIVQVIEGEYAGQLGKVLPYNGLWVHLEFLDARIKPKDKYFPLECVKLIKEE